jgi:hypothetical protein
MIYLTLKFCLKIEKKYCKKVIPVKTIKALNHASNNLNSYLETGLGYGDRN